MATITIKGTGSASVRPDTIRLGFELKARSMDCGEAMDKASAGADELRGILADMGFQRDELKTAGFDVRAEYQSQPDEKGAYRSVFTGYCCDHSMKLEFPLDTKRLAEVLRAVSDSEAAPEIRVSFIAKDTEEAKRELMRSCAENARKKAELLCEASGARLGKLIRISSTASGFEPVSATGFAADISLMRAAPKAAAIDIVPDDISLQDSAEFEWELL